MAMNLNVEIPGKSLYCDVFLSYEFAKSIVEEQGFAGWLTYLKDSYPEKGLYVISTAWFLNENFICKAKGSYGDLLIGWK